MKSLFVLASLLLLAPRVSMAVNVADCPKKIDLEISDLHVISAETLRKESSVMDNEDGSLEKFRQMLAKLERITVKAKLDKANSARCSYVVTDSSVSDDKNDEIIFATSHGKDWLRVRLNVKEGIIGGYVTVTDYAKNAIVVADTASLGYDNASHPGILEPTMAWAKDVSAK